MKLQSETSLRWSHARPWTVLRHFPISFNAWQQQSHGISMAHPVHQSSHSLTTVLYDVKIVLLFKLKYCIRNHAMKYLYTQNLWKFSFNVHNRADSCLLKFMDDKGATHRLLKELNVGCWDWNCLLVIWYQYLIIFLDICNAVCWVKYYDCPTKENDFGSLCKFGLSVYFDLSCLAKSFVSLYNFVEKHILLLFHCRCR